MKHQFNSKQRPILCPQDPESAKEGEDTDEEGKPTHKWEIILLVFPHDHCIFHTLIQRCRLLIKSAILLPTAKQDEVNIVQIESEGYNKEKVLSLQS